MVTCGLGTQDNDNDGNCTANCATAVAGQGYSGTCTNCGTSRSSFDNAAAAATAACNASGCQAGCSVPQSASDHCFFDGTINGYNCTSFCGPLPLVCDHGGACDDSSGTASCACTTGYTGANCDSCATGYQDNDGNGTCAATCATAALNCNGGVCSDSSGAATCTQCPLGYEGATCTSCAAGFQDNDHNGTCTATCASVVEGQGYSGTCNNCGTSRSSFDNAAAAATAACSASGCQAGCSVPQSASDHCFFDGTINGYNCTSFCGPLPLVCNHGGTCDDSAGTAGCSCATGYTGTTCDSCASGYQDNDGNGTCAPTCATAALNCNGGVCDDSSGAATCTQCPAGFGGPTCSTCATGYQDNDGNHTCTANCATAAAGQGYSGTCVNCGTSRNSFNVASAAATSACNASGCQAGCSVSQSASDNCFFDGNINGYNCTSFCGPKPLVCDHGGACDDSSGTAVCACATGYTGAACDACATGYQDNDGNGTCTMNCASATAGQGYGGTCTNCGTSRNSYNAASAAATNACNASGCQSGCSVSQSASDDCFFDGTINGYNCTSFCGPKPALVCLGSTTCNDSSGTAVCQ